jgi:predicted MPP superfamily phosphohydrolase
MEGETNLLKSERHSCISGTVRIWRRARAQVESTQTLRDSREGMITRRKLLRRSLQVAGSLGAVAAAGIGYGFWEASDIRIQRRTLPVPNLPPAFAGKKVALLADLHHGNLVGLDFVRRAVDLANALQPDLIALLGDYVHRRPQSEYELPRCLAVLSNLTAPLGVFAVPGNHDMYGRGQVYRDSIARTPLTDLTNRAQSIRSGGAELWLAGVDDLWRGRPDLGQALADVPAGAAVVLLCHNPDYAEVAPEPRVGLMLSGHTHGGQVYLPVLGAPWIPSDYGEKYRQGLVQGPASRVFVSRGLGETGIPIRFNVPPEINLLTLVAG